jgi:DNA-directed RNA polymerase subunit RPC12/RpoP
MRIKAVRCRGCGAPKQTEPKTAYIYCDYCGTFTDWDFYKAASIHASQLPGGPQEERNSPIPKITAKIEKAFKKKDRDGYEGLQRRLFTYYADRFPAFYSPRLGDPKYRDAIIEYQAQLYTFTAFDPKLKSLSDKRDRAVEGVKWKEADTGYVATSSSYWKLLHAVENLTRAYLLQAEKNGLLASHPDRINAELTMKTTFSMMAAAWQPYLSANDFKAVLAYTGLEGEYNEVTPPPANLRRCAVCGTGLHAFAGAQQLLCEQCGFIIQVNGIEIPCPGCGALLSLPVRSDRFQCPYCGSRGETYI